MGGEARADVEASVAEYISAVCGSAPGLAPAGIESLEARLASSTFLVGGTLSAADLVAFAAAHPAVASLQFEPARFTNVARWFDLIQRTADPKGAFPRVALVPAVAPPLEAVFAALKVGGGGKGGEGKCGGKGEEKGKARGEGKTDAKGKTKGGAGSQGEEAPIGGGSGSTGPAGAPPSDEVAALRAAKKVEKARKQAEKKAKKGGGESAPARDIDVSLLDIRVGRILSAEHHPEADALYVEQIDVGESVPRTIVSGLRKFVALEAMQDRPCVVLCNLKPAKMRGVLSSGMVLCASNGAHDAVEPLAPPAGAAPGARVTCEGFPGEPEGNVKKMEKVFKAVAPDLRTDTAGVAGYKGTPLGTPEGACVAPSLPDCEVK